MPRQPCSILTLRRFSDRAAVSASDAVHCASRSTSFALALVELAGMLAKGSLARIMLDLSGLETAALVGQGPVRPGLAETQPLGPQSLGASGH